MAIFKKSGAEMVRKDNGSHKPPFYAVFKGYNALQIPPSPVKEWL